MTVLTLLAVVQRVRGVDVETLSAWVAQEWVRPRREEGAPVFEEVDVARIRLIVELRELDVGEGAMPVVLSLLDQLHAARARAEAMAEALIEARRPGRSGSQPGVFSRS